MRLRYELTRWDLFKAQLLAIPFQRPVVVFLLLFLVGMWAFVFCSQQSLEDADIIFSAIAATVVTLLAGSAVAVITAILVAFRTLVGSDPGVLGEHTLELTDEGLIESTAVNRSVHSWATPFRVRPTIGYVFVFITRDQGHIIPLNRAPLEGSVGLFLEELQARIHRTDVGAE